MQIAPDPGGVGQSGDQTQWGQRGSAAGQFDFGSGFGASELMGSVVVDDDGFIYVGRCGQPADSEVRAVARENAATPKSFI